MSRGFHWRNYLSAISSNSEQLAEGIVAKWIEDVKAQKNLKFYEAVGCNTLTILDMIENIKAVVDTTNLTGIIAKTNPGKPGLANHSIFLPLRTASTSFSPR